MLLDTPQQVDEEYPLPYLHYLAKRLTVRVVRTKPLMDAKCISGVDRASTRAGARRDSWTNPYVLLTSVLTVRTAITMSLRLEAQQRVEGIQQGNPIVRIYANIVKYLEESLAERCLSRLIVSRYDIAAR